MNWFVMAQSWYACPCGAHTYTPYESEVFCHRGCAVPKEYLKKNFHTCKFTKQIPMLNKVIGVCDCGKEKELNADEIDFTK